MRGRLWPEANCEELAREVAEFLRGQALPTPHVVFVAADPQPVGFLELSLRPYANGCDSMPVPFVEGWYVEQKARGRGVGRSLLLAAEDWCRERGYAEIGSDTQLWNADSLQAHLRCGFEEAERVIALRKKLE